MTISENRLLVVDDEGGIRNLFGVVAGRLGFEVRSAANKEEFAEKLFDFRPTVLMIDLHLEGSSGTDILRFLGHVESQARVFLISGSDLRVLYAAEDLGKLHGLDMAGVLQKPVMLAELESVLLKEMSPLRITEEGLLDAIENGDFERYDFEELEKVEKQLARAEAAFHSALAFGGPERKTEDESDYTMELKQLSPEDLRRFG